MLAIGTTLAAGLLVRFLTGTLRHRSVHDPLTGLANRRLYLTALDEALERAREDQRAGSVAVLFLDLDGFKYVNDSLGHHVGDGLLAAVGERLQATARPEDLTARFGGDEFALLCCGLAHEDDALAIGQRINEALDRGLPDRRPRAAHLGQRRRRDLRARSTATAARCCATPTPRCTRPRRADARAASCSATRCGRRWSDGSRSRTSCGPRSTATSSRSTTSRSSSLEDRRIVGVEALVRWNHPGARADLARATSSRSPRTPA